MLKKTKLISNLKTSRSSIKKKQPKVKKVSKKSTSTLINKLNNSNDYNELTSLANKTKKQEKAFDNLSKYHNQDKAKEEESKKVEDDIMRQLEMIGGFNL